LVVPVLALMSVAASVAVHATTYSVLNQWTHSPSLCETGLTPDVVHMQPNATCVARDCEADSDGGNATRSTTCASTYAPPTGAVYFGVLRYNDVSDYNCVGDFVDAAFFNTDRCSPEVPEENGFNASSSQYVCPDGSATGMQHRFYPNTNCSGIYYGYFLYQEETCNGGTEYYFCTGPGVGPALPTSPPTTPPPGSGSGRTATIASSLLMAATITLTAVLYLL